MWVIVAVLISFVLTFTLALRKLNFGVSLLVGALVLGLLTLSISTLAETILKTLINSTTIELMVSVILIASFGFLYEETEKLGVMSENLERIVSDGRVITMAIPALFGMLPMYGGALLSAPVLNAEGEKLKMNNTRRAFVNLWFRHVSHFIYPLGSPIILAAYLSGMSVSLLALSGLPASIVAITIGYVIGLRKVENNKQKADISREPVKNVLLLISPILIAIILTILAGVKTYFSITIGLLLLIVIAKSSLKMIYSAFKKAVSRVVLATLTAIIFGNIIYAAKLPETVSSMTQGTTIPWIIIAIMIPLVLGIFMGNITASVAISIPILAAMTTLTPISVSLICTSALLGYIVSPLHLCFILTNEYFKTRTVDVYRLLIPTALTTMTSTALIATYFILR